MTDQIEDLRFETKQMKLPSAPVSERSVVPIVLLLCIPLGVGLALAAMYYSGAFAQLVTSPGAVVSNGLPMVTAVFDGSAAVTVGLLVVSTFVLPGQTKNPKSASFSQWYATRWAGWAALVWLLSAITVLVFTAANTLSVPFTSPTFQSQFLFVVFQLEIGQTWLVTIGCIAVALVILLVTKNVSWLATATVFSIFALLPLALSGHSAGSLQHVNAVNSLAMHLVGVTVWMGGLIAVILLRNKAGKHLATVVSRYSMMAIWAFGFVAFSGVINASLRLTGPLDLFRTTYGQLILIKSIILIGLGVAGYFQRRSVIPGLVRQPTRTRSFVRLAVSEVVFMAVAMGLSVALSKSPPPVPQTTDISQQAALLGWPMPKPITLPRFLFGFHPDWFFIAVSAIMATLYIVGVVKLKRRGDSWSWGRTVPWLVGCFGLFFATSGGPSVYGAVNFSTHMIQHMVLMMYVPPLLVLGAPILLSLRTLPKRRDNSRGAREWILIITHSRYANVITNPIVAAIIFAGSLVAFYYSGWFEASLQTHPGHFIMEVHFLLAGYLFFFVVIGVDPGPKRPPYPFRVILLMATLAFHAFFGLALMTQTTVLASDWWHALGETNTAALLADQHVGGAIAWGAGEFPTVLIALVVVRQWVKSDERIARRYDRRAETDGDAELNAYNEQLQQMAAHERPGRPQG
ncbi:cytochrome c oxidase assembly protein [Frondihabitans sp. PAMC 28766]|uniref:cytochrome c oxidase assembly protein n=1 Tax=Frondihabitans sp. PAMC 28766 TaxID=1795630 RepID=UPI000AE1646A|nr:cytochrome c oxidase assembly protein [Frondihabitans sp. PAMC 28766]